MKAPPVSLNPIKLGMSPAPHGGEISLEAISEESAQLLAPLIATLSPWARYPYPADALARYLSTAEPGAPRYAIRSGSTLAGAVGLREGWLRGPYIQMFALLPGFQGHGIGSQILHWVEADARGKSERNLWVCASDFNSDALRFYERHGFARVALLEGLVSSTISEVLLRKQLDEAPVAGPREERN